MTTVAAMADVVGRFTKFVDKHGQVPAKYTGVTTRCHLWLGSVNGSGYGKFWLGDRLVGAHVAAHVLFVGPVGNSHVLHHCDNRRCVNPTHTFLGSQAINNADTRAKGRQTPPAVMSRILLKAAARGECHWNAKLTPAVVEAIRAKRALGALQRELALEFGVSRSCISLVLSGSRWRRAA